MTEQVYTIDEVAKRFKVSTETVRRWIWSGKLIAFHAGKNIRITEASIQLFLEESNKTK